MSAPVDCPNLVSTGLRFRDASAISGSAISAIGGNRCGGYAAGGPEAGLVAGRNPAAMFLFARGGRDRICDSLGGTYALWLDDAFEVASTDYSGGGATLGARRDEYSTNS